MKSAISLHNLTFHWPDGTPALSGLTGSFTPGRTGLVGRNGTGKSTLLRLMAGQLEPSSGRLECSGEVGYLPQNLTLRSDITIAGLLGIEHILAAMNAIESGDVGDEHFDTIGDDWDIESRADEELQRIGFSAADLERRVAEVSGGEAMLIAVTGLRIRRTPITLLDEPTNNLDRSTRARLTRMVDEWPGTLVVVSHDLELLEHMENTSELHAGELETFGGPYSDWKTYREQEQAAAMQAAHTAQQTLKVEKRQRAEAETKLARRERTAQKTQKDGGIPKILAGKRASNAQVSAGKLRGTTEDKIAAAQAAVDASDARVRDEQHIKLELPDPQVPRGKRIAEIHDGGRTFVIQGPERVALVGPNGSGKSTLLARLLAGNAAPGNPGGRDAAGDTAVGRAAPGGPHGVLLTDRVGYLPQRLDGLDDGASALENVRSVAPATPPGTIRNQLARLLLRGAAADRPVGTLSGGERFRVSLAKLLLADPPAQLLVLDEPTNNLDISSTEQLAEALGSYRGAVLIVSHDFAFLERLGIDTVLELGGDGRLRPKASVAEA
ncbi:ABC-F family ATP-binding cassette domain-containing protein [Arthrobacter cupressi]|uniref:ATPase components of ABC transporters with duplicated ATPase domains n=1 Tax=Arthrobacter cupressi TaxID=1045773 RepID=A0A1G8IBD9_9MICC|nr:ABC-F family ATP-binding cassette domain-containing protein [Arthrobacter cupressi]NYD78961.1 ATPase subunit of ABC transporter with duplicated ATPase domains [Arthrobacter cupressi]SDI16204.1 ATPase components of ABC transporters with duplicated ATPase domains [Arthrobacter cupressi]